MHDEIKTYPISLDSHAHADFVVKEMGSLYEQTAGKPDRPHRHDYYTVVHVEQAVGSHYVDFRHYPLVSNSLFFIYPGQVHQVIAESRPKGTVLNFTGEFLVRNSISERMIDDIYLYNDYGESPPLLLDDRQNGNITALFGQMKELSGKEYVYRTEGLGALLKLLFIESIQVCSKRGTSDIQAIETGNQLIRRFKKRLGEHYASTHKVTDYASLLSVSPDYLNKTLKTISGNNAKELIQHKLLLAAKRTLLFTDASNKEIAFQLGFEEPSHFSNFFKRLTGQTPATFRETARNT